MRRRHFPRSVIATLPVLFLLSFLVVSTGIGLESAPLFPDDMDLTFSRLSTRAREFTERLHRGEFKDAVATFDVTMHNALPEDRLAATWKGVTSQNGSFKEVLGFRLEQVQVYQIVLVRCQFEKGILDVKVVFDRNDKIGGLFFVESQGPETYGFEEEKAPSSVREEEVTFGDSPWALPGTLTLPRGEGPFPGLVLVHGSGPNDRDETYGPNKPFRDLAWGLASRGVAVLRYDKRTLTHRFKVMLSTTLTVKEETIDDALAAVSFLASRAEVAPKRVFILGHSLGGYLVPRIDQQARKASIRPCGYILLAAPTRSLLELLVEQTEYIASVTDSMTEEQRKASIEKTRRQVEKVGRLTADSPKIPVLGVTPSYWLDLKPYRPLEDALAVEVPLLILQGEKDYQVTMTDFNAWKEQFGHRTSVRLKSYRNLNHHFIEVAREGRSVPADYMKKGKVADEVIADAASFILGAP